MSPARVLIRALMVSLGMRRLPCGTISRTTASLADLAWVAAEAMVLAANTSPRGPKSTAESTINSRLGLKNFGMRVDWPDLGGDFTRHSAPLQGASRNMPWRAGCGVCERA